MQNIINGITTLPQILNGVGSRKLFLVVDSSYPFLNLRNAIEALQVDKICFSDFTPNPLYEQVCNGIDLFKTSGCDTIIAVGGGSAIDVAKCIKLATLATEGKNAIIPPLVSKPIPIDGSMIPFIAIPTTAGTGSESTHNAVMYYEGAKQTVTNDGVLPDFAVLEPTVLKTLPLYQKKCTMMDALCQGIESWWSVNATVESKIYSQKAIELIMSNWEAYIYDNDLEASSKIMLGANYSGRAINIAQTTAPHAMSYKITSLYKLPHGHAVSICLPVVWEYMLQNTSEVLNCNDTACLQSIFLDISRSLGEDSPTKAILRLRKMLGDLDFDQPLSSNYNEDLHCLSESVNPVRLKNTPIYIDSKDFILLYSKIIKRQG